MEVGSCEIFLGPMFSGKTSAMCRKINRARYGGLPCVIVKYAKDKRYAKGGVIQTHEGNSLTSSQDSDDMAALRIVEAENLGDVRLNPGENDIGVDEAQFYKDLPETVDKWMNEGRRVYVAGLDGTWRREPFGRISELIPRATYITKLAAVCMMANHDPPAEAFYTVKTVQDNVTELIGGKETYKAACPTCYHTYYARLQDAKADRSEESMHN